MPLKITIIINLYEKNGFSNKYGAVIYGNHVQQSKEGKITEIYEGRGSLKVYIWKCNIISNSRKIMGGAFSQRSGTEKNCIPDFLGGRGAKWGLDEFQN